MIEASKKVVQTNKYHYNERCVDFVVEMVTELTITLTKALERKRTR